MKLLRKGLWPISVVATVSAMALAAVALASPTRDSVPGGTFRIGSSYGFDTLNPLLSVGLTPFKVMPAIYPQLCHYDKKVRIVPDFARSWKVSNGGKRLTFTTRAGAKWSDGQPLTARDFAFTFNTTLKYQKIGVGAVFATVLAGAKSAQAPNDTSLVLNFPKAQPLDLIFDSVCFIPGLPAHEYGKHLGNGGKDMLKFTDPKVSGGPFVVVKFSKNRIGLFGRNNSYYGAKPKVDGFGVQNFSNPDGMVTALRTGAIDMIDGASATAVLALEKAKGVKIARGPGVQQDQIVLNVLPKKKNHKALADSRVQEAMSLAIDRRRIVEVVHVGAAKATASPIAPAAGRWYNPSASGRFSIARANAILDKAGYTRGGDGVRIDPRHANESLSFEVVTTTGNPGVDRMFSIMKADFAKIGINLRNRQLDPAAAGDYTRKGTAWDAILWNSTFQVDPDPYLFLYTSAGAPSSNYFGYSNKTVDRLFQAQRTELNREKRRRIVWKLQTILAKASPWIVIDYRDNQVPYSDKWKGVVILPDSGFSYLANLTVTSVERVG